ncbi:MAG TPA: Co2+/Mg2+ efflux protein ApaG [Bryobacteraceae bacterium]|nr:Co2+/Mg2+ efflux protein ApaG [Bryobacteraceae bacterium]
MYCETTHGIRVSVKPRFLPEQSSPAESRYFWAYTVEIANETGAPVQVLARHWVITDANGHRQDVRGPGVVGEQPIVTPGDSFTYTSGCPLTTPSGIMAGTYEVREPGGEVFQVAIPAFSLDLPGARQILN